MMKVFLSVATTGRTDFSVRDQDLPAAFVTCNETCAMRRLNDQSITKKVDDCFVLLSRSTFSSLRDIDADECATQ